MGNPRQLLQAGLPSPVHSSALPWSHSKWKCKDISHISLSLIPLTVPSAPCPKQASRPDTPMLSQYTSVSAHSISPSTSSEASHCTHHVPSLFLSPSSSTSHFIYNSSPQAQLINKALLSSPNPSSKTYVHHDAL